MPTRENILAAIRQNKPTLQPLPERIAWGDGYPDPVRQFKTVLPAIGAIVVDVPDYEAIRAYVREVFVGFTNIAVTVPELSDLADFSLALSDPHELEHIELAILPGCWGVAENGAVWLTEAQMQHRALPFITQHLALVLCASQILPTMHAAYDRIRVDETGFGTFLAGPSKTADIEQSLVIGAHGARSLVVFLLP